MTIYVRHSHPSPPPHPLPTSPILKSKNGGGKYSEVHFEEQKWGREI